MLNRFTIRLISAVALFALAVLPQHASRAQQQLPAAAPPGSADETLAVETSLVVLQVRVVDSLNRPVRDARQDEFQVFDNDAPQVISFFSREEAPISYGLVVGNTSSLQTQIGKVIGLGKTIISDNRPGEDLFLAHLEPGSDTNIHWDFTADSRALFEALDRLRAHHAAMALYDTIYFSAEHVAESAADRVSSGTPRRRAMILLTDGVDNGSFYKPEALLARLRDEDVQVYAIGFIEKLEGAKREQSVAFINRLAQETGGRAFFPASFDELPKIAEEIKRDLRTQYVVGYRPDNNLKEGALHRVRVTVVAAPGKDKRTAITRSGYTVPPRDKR